MKSPVVIGTRGSELALWQANYLKRHFNFIDVECEIKIITTQGDKIQNLSFDKMEGKGFFTKEIEEALLKNEIDVAVHSYKDLPTESPSGLCIAACSYREKPSDCLLIRRLSFDPKKLYGLKQGAIVGTSSTRRQAQLLAFRKDLKIKPLRGNVPTRINKLKNKEYDAIMVAYAGILRLSLMLGDLYMHVLDCEDFVPAPAQGVLAFQIKRDNRELYDTLRKLNNKPVEKITGIEREILRKFEGGCQIPIGIYCNEKDEKIHVHIAKSNDAEHPPIRYYKSFDVNTKNIPSQVVTAIQNSWIKKVFITRDMHKESMLEKTLNGNHISLSGKSLIKINPLDFQIPKEKYDWIFFSSKNAVTIFFNKCKKLPGNVQVAALGEATKFELCNYNILPDFAGNSNDIAEVGKAFSVLANGDKVLFPKSEIGLNNIKNQLTPQTMSIDLPVYTSILCDDFEIPDGDAIVFTSPSNVEAYYRKYCNKKMKKVIAIGKSTENKLKEFGFENICVARLPNDLGILEQIFN